MAYEGFKGLMRWKPRTLALALLAGFMTLGLAAPADAGHDARQRKPAKSFKLRLGAQFGHRNAPAHNAPNRWAPVYGAQVFNAPVRGNSTSCFPTRSPRQIRFDRGFQAGKLDGWSEGHYDGLDGKPRCGTPHKSLRNRAPAYRRGYLKAYAESYDAGFRQGRRERYFQHSGWKPRHRH